jgi:glutamyl-tRNA reductase
MNMHKGGQVSGAAEIHVLGLSHKTAPVYLREKFSLTCDSIPAFLNDARCAGVDEIVYLCTCNRVEIYYTAADTARGSAAIWSLLESRSGKSHEELRRHFYQMQSLDAVRHCLSVAASLDSMVVGENEILGQIKEAYRIAAESSSTGVVLNRLFHHAFHCAKRVKTETDIARNPLSIAYIACEQARKVFDDLSTKKALLIGAGEMGELILKYLGKFNIRDITLANRSRCNAEKISQAMNSGARIIGLDEIPAQLARADIVISSVTAPDYVIAQETLKDLARERKGRPLFIIDIAVPRNVDPGASALDDVFLFNIDDLNKIADDNMKIRLGEVEGAVKIIEAAAGEFMRWYDDLEVIPAIERITSAFNEIRTREADKYRRRKLKHLSEDDFRLVLELTEQIMNKSLHNPIMALKDHHASRSDAGHDCEELREKTRIIKELFDRHENTP